MLDIQKELEKFNRLLEEIDDSEQREDGPAVSQDEPESEEELESTVVASPAADLPAPRREDRIPPEPARTRAEAKPKPDPETSAAAHVETDPGTPGKRLRHSWTIVEHVQPDDRADVESVRELDRLGADNETSSHTSAPLFGPPAPAAFDSIMKGAKTALTETHRPKPKAKPPVTVTLPSIDELEADVERERSFRERLMPIVASQMDVLRSRVEAFQPRPVALVGLAAAVVVFAAGLLMVPRLLSGDQDASEALASNPVDSDSVHLLSSADDLASPQMARLSVSSYPPGARVYLGAELVGVTPFKGITVSRGLHSVTIRKADFVSVDTMLSLDESTDLFFQLAAAAAEPETDDYGDVLIVEGQDLDVGRQPSSERSSPAAAPARVEEPVRQPERSNRQSPPQTTESRPTGSVVITSDPAGATVFIDDRAVGETPLTLDEVDSGRTRVTMQREGYVPYEIEINVMPSLQTPFHAVLAPMKGRIRVSTEGGADLYIDGMLLGRSIRPDHVEVVDVGKHEVRLVHPTFGPWSATVSVQADQTASVEVNLADRIYETAVASGDKLFGESRYSEAIEAYNRALAVRPGVKSIESKLGLAAKAMTETELPPADASGVYSVVDTPPQLIGGLEALHRNVQYPAEAYQEGVQGRVYVQLVVDQEGRPTDIKIAKGLPMGCNEAAIRAVEKSRFTPGLVNGQAVKARHTVFVNFTID